MKNVIFCYGTLKRQGTAHGLMGNATFLSEATTHPRYRLYDMGGFPGMVEGSEHGYGVKGELFECDEETLKRLDLYEGVEYGLFERKDVELDDGSFAEAYFFLRDRRGRKVIPEGVWN